MQEDVRQRNITRLLELLSCNDLDVHETEAIVLLCLQVLRDPARTLAENYGEDAAQIARYDPSGVLAFVIATELEDYFAVSDTVDELHEEIVAAFETPMLPDYPYDNNTFVTVTDYFGWLDEQLLLHHPRYCLIEFGQSYTHDFQTILVGRATLSETLALCEQLDIVAQPCITA